MTLTRRQLRAARAMTGLSMRDLAADAGVGRTTIHGIENGKTVSGRGATLDALQRSLERHGIELGRDGWIRHREDSPDRATAALEPAAIVTLARTCRAAREARAWTRADLAARLGISAEFYGRIEEGAVVPSLAILIQLAAVLRVSLDDMLGLTRERTAAGVPSRTGRRTSTDPLAERLQRASPGVRRAVMMLLLELER